MNDSLTFSSLYIQQMQSLAAALALVLKAGDVITLKGDLGAGKTMFARALIQKLSPDTPEVISPTFMLMQSYDVTIAGAPQTLWHLDLYRLKDINEAQELGLEDLWPQLVLIEWPDIIDRFLPASHLAITFEWGALPDTRTVQFHGNDAWRSRLKNIHITV